MKKICLKPATNIFVKKPFYFKLMKVFLLTLIPLFSSAVNAHVPEPDNILHGAITFNGSLITSADTDVTIRFELMNGNEIASYQMGSGDIGNNFILRVPIDVLEPRNEFAARPDDIGQIYLTKADVNQLIGTAVIGEKGSILTINFTAIADADNDGIQDSLDSCPNGNTGWTSNPTSDFDGDGCRDATEDLDDDNDGLSDIFEVANGLNPLDATGVNGASGDADGDGFTNLEEQTLGTDASAATGASSNPGIISFSDTTYSVNENGGSLNATVTRSGGSVGVVTALCFSADIASQAVAGIDYTAISTTISWADGDANDKTCDVLISDDSDIESDETFQLDLSSPSGGAKLVQ